jgi:hypothetical protein
MEIQFNPSVFLDYLITLSALAHKSHRIWSYDATVKTDAIFFAGEIQSN